MKQMTLTVDTLRRHILSRRLYYQYVMSSAKSHGGIIPAAWDAGGKGDKTMTIFDRKTGAIFDLGLLNAIRYGWGMGKLPGDTSLVQTVTGANAAKILYNCGDSAFGQVELGAVKTDWSNYDSIIVRAFVNGETNYGSAGIRKYGWLALSLVTMSKNWTWREGRFGTIVMNDWNNYSIPISSDTTNEKAMVPADPTKIDFFALHAYSQGYRGTIYLDWIVFKTKSGSSDTLYNFNIVPDVIKGNVKSVSLISAGAVPLDQEWKTATTSKWNTAVLKRSQSLRKEFKATALHGFIQATWVAERSGASQITLQNLQGSTILSRSMDVHTGLNTFKIPVDYRGILILQIKQSNRIFTRTIFSR